MDITLRVPTDADWPAVLRVANEALPSAANGNATWVSNRRGFDATTRTRRQYVADVDGVIVGYGAIEEDAKPGRYRVFVVMSPARLSGDIGDAVYARLRRDLDELHARVAWLREEANDRSIVAFAAKQGFAEAQRFAVDGVDIIVLELILRSAHQQPTANS
jgi:hypothetical protein